LPTDRRLGFETSHHYDTYAFAHGDGNLTVHLAQAEEVAGSLYLRVDDAEQLAAEWRKAGVDVVGPEDIDYGKREASKRVPDGNLIRFGPPVPPPRVD
jgi:hypothetical protein